MGGRASQAFKKIEISRVGISQDDMCECPESHFDHLAHIVKRFDCKTKTIKG